MEPFQVVKNRIIAIRLTNVKIFDETARALERIRIIYLRTVLHILDWDRGDAQEL